MLTLAIVAFLSFKRPELAEAESIRISAAEGQIFSVINIPHKGNFKKRPSISEPLLLEPVFSNQPQESSKDELLDFIKQFEGFAETTTYDIDGALMIGYGFRKEDIPDLKWGDTMTEEEGHEVLVRVVERFEKVVDEIITVPVTENQINAMVSFSYNIGPNAFKRSLTAKETNKGNYDKAADCFKYWCKINGRRSKGLVRRRAAEKEMYLRKDEKS